MFELHGSSHGIMDRKSSVDPGKKLHETEILRLDDRLKVLKDSLSVKGITPDQADKLKKDFINTLIEGERNILGWTDDTNDYQRVNEVEMMLCTGYNLEFVRTHHKMSALFDAMANIAGDVNIRHIYEKLAEGKDGSSESTRIYVGEMRKDQQSGKSDFTGNMVDIYDEAHWQMIKKFYLSAVHPLDRQFNDKSITALENEYRRGLGNKNEPLKIKIRLRNEEGKYVDQLGKAGKVLPDGHFVAIEVDLKKLVERPSISAAEFKAYYSTVKECQPSLQAASMLRDVSISGHHAENGGHAQLMEGMNGEKLYVPASGVMATSYELGEVNKIDARTRAGGHPHQFGYYNENFGLCIGLDARLMEVYRGKILDHYIYGNTTERVRKNLFGLSSSERPNGANEEPMWDKKTKTFYFGRRAEAGKDTQYGNIYTAMHSHYDQTMKEKRGYGITTEEAGDKIITDLVGVHFATAPRDFIMNFGLLTGEYAADAAMRTETVLNMESEGQPVFVFYCKRPKNKKDGSVETTIDGTVNTQRGPDNRSTTREWKKIKEQSATWKEDSDDFGELRIKGFTGLAYYLQWRANQGEILGLPAKQQISVDVVDDIVRKGGSEEEKAKQDAEQAESEKNKAEGRNKDSTQDANGLANILIGAFGNTEKALVALDIASGESGEQFEVVSKGQKKTVSSIKDVKDRLIDVFGRNPALANEAKKISGESESDRMAGHIVTQLADISADRDVLKSDVLIAQISEVGETGKDNLLTEIERERMSVLLPAIFGKDVAKRYVESKLGKGERPLQTVKGVDGQGKPMREAMDIDPDDNSPVFRGFVGVRAGKHGNLTGLSGNNQEKANKIIKDIGRARDEDWFEILEKINNPRTN